MLSRPREIKSKGFLTFLGRESSQDACKTTWICCEAKERMHLKLDTVAQACNPSYLGSGDG
jgi:hypothetical protein